MVEERTKFGTSWLIVRDEGGSPQILTLGDEEKTLPVFSYEEEALLFLRLSGLGDDWHVGGHEIPDLVSILADTCVEARHVALDPIPEIGLHGSHRLVSLSRDEFVGALTSAR